MPLSSASNDDSNVQARRLQAESLAKEDQLTQLLAKVGAGL